MATELNRPVPERARHLVQEARRLAEEENFAAAEANFRQAIQLAPHCAQAHLDLVTFKAYYLEEVAGAEAEYKELAERETNNPIYPFVLARILPFAFQGPEKEVLERAATLVPGWYWAHLARADLHRRERNYDDEMRELEEFVRYEPAFEPAWADLARALEKLERWGEAERAYQKLAKLRRAPFSVGVWRARLKAAGESEAARARLRRELEHWQKKDLAPRYRMDIARAYRDLLADTTAAQAIEEAVKRSHPDWERELYDFDRTSSSTHFPAWDRPERILSAGRQAWLHGQLGRIFREEKDVSQKIVRIRALLQERPQPSLRRNMQWYLFSAQIEAKDWPGAKTTLAELLASKPESVEERLKLALALADNNVDLEEALRLVEEAKALRREFRPWERPKQFGVVEWEKNFTLERQRQAYNNALAAIADARGWVLAQQGKLEEAERELRTALGLNPTPQAQYHLGVVLDRRGEFEEALDLLVKAAAREGSQQQAARQAAEAVFEKRHAAGVEALIARARVTRLEEKRAQLRREFTQEPAKDFELVALDGQSYRLSALRGKVVLINFWSTWCGPCVEELPELVRLYQKYREAGLEILAISIDDDKAKLTKFVSERKLPFPVFLDTKVGPLYDVGGIPDNCFIDLTGNLRYRQRGFGAGIETILEAVLQELLASTPAPTPAGPMPRELPDSLCR